MKQTKEDALRQAAAGYDEVFFIDDNPRHLSDSLGIVTCPIWKENRHHLFLWQSIDHSGIRKAQSAKTFWILLSAKTRKKSRNSQTLFRLFFYAPLRLYIR